METGRPVSITNGLLRRWNHGLGIYLFIYASRQNKIYIAQRSLHGLAWFYFTVVFWVGILKLKALGFIIFDFHLKLKNSFICKQEPWKAGYYSFFYDHAKIVTETGELIKSQKPRGIKAHSPPNSSLSQIT